MGDYKIINARFSQDGELTDIYVEDGIIAKIGNCSKYSAETYDAQGNLAAPGLIDLNCSICSPGYEFKEDFDSITKAAEAAGYATITCQPNVKPVADNKAVIEYIISKSKENKYVNILPYGSMTLKMKGEYLSEIGEMYADGIVAISDGGESIHNANLLRSIMIYSKMFGIPVITSCCDTDIACSGVINEGYVSTLTGLKGIPREAEEIIVARNLLLAQHTKAKLHITQVSTSGSVDLIKNAKKHGINVTCDTSPQYFALTEYLTLEYNTFAKVMPPLRTHKDKAAILEGLSDGTIDAISSGHSPTTIETKLLEFDAAEYGISSLETVFAVSYTELVTKGVLSIEQLIQKLCENPAKILGMGKCGKLESGYKGDISIFDVTTDYKIHGSSFKSKAKFTPYENNAVKGRAIKTFVADYWA